MIAYYDTVPGYKMADPEGSWVFSKTKSHCTLIITIKIKTSSLETVCNLVNS